MSYLYNHPQLFVWGLNLQPSGDKQDTVLNLHQNVLLTEPPEHSKERVSLKLISSTTPSTSRHCEIKLGQLLSLWALLVQWLRWRTKKNDHLFHGFKSCLFSEGVSEFLQRKLRIIFVLKAHLSDCWRPRFRFSGLEPPVGSEPTASRWDTVLERLSNHSATAPHLPTGPSL